jgi:DNA-binding protein YbaB
MEMNDRMETARRHVRELLEAHAAQAEAITHTAGHVRVSVDSRLRLTRVHIDDASIPGEKRAAIEKAIVEAVNAATRQAVQSLANALSALHSSEEWKGVVIIALGAFSVIAVGIREDGAGHALP